MKKVVFNFWLDFSIFLVFAGMAVTGFVLKWVLPSRCGEGSGWSGGWVGVEGLGEEGARWFLGIHRSQWLDAHFTLSLLLAALILVHFVMHWNWIRCVMRTQLFRWPAGRKAERRSSGEKGLRPDGGPSGSA